MMKSINVVLLSAFAILSQSSAVAMQPSTSFNLQTKVAEVQKLTGLSQTVVTTAVKGYEYALQHASVQNHVLTIVNFEQPATQKRLYTIDMDNNKLLFNGLVAHGQGSGGRYMPTKFSNAPQSRASSLGVYVTGSTYMGKHGYSLRVNGLEAGINSNAAARTIVVHPANYVSEAIAKQTNGLGRSWGCFALEPTKSKQLISAIKNGSVIFAFANQEINDPHLALV